MLRMSGRYLVLFACLVAVLGYFADQIYAKQLALTKNKARSEIIVAGNNIRTVMEQSLNALHTLVAVVDQSHGKVEQFEALAARLLPLHPGILSLQLAPQGRLNYIYPLEGNEAVLGMDLFASARTRPGAMQAYRSGTIVMDGPYQLLQGGYGVLARLPVYVSSPSLPNSQSEQASRTFWGLAIALIRFPQALEGSSLADLAQLGYQYQLWTQNAQTGQPLVISNSQGNLQWQALADSIHYDFQISGRTWSLAMTRSQGWGNPLLFSLLLLLTLLLAFIVTRLVYSAQHSKISARHFEGLVSIRNEQLRQSEKELHRAQEVAGIGSWCYDCVKNGRVLTPQARAVLNWPSEVMTFRQLMARVPEAYHDTVAAAWFHEPPQKQKLVEYPVVVNQQERWLREFSESRVTTVGVELIGTVQDITESKSQQEMIWRQAHYDSLTGLPNRYYLLKLMKEYMAWAQESGQSFAIIFVDIDDFKWVNDALGHLEGDKILQILAERLSLLLPPDNAVAARVSGDEFVILMRLVPTGGDVEVFLSALLSAFEQPVQAVHRQVQVSCSAGIAVYPDDGLSAEELLGKSDLAMYHAKNQGKHNFSFFTRDMAAEANEKRHLEAELKAAINNQDFELYYQPIIEADTGRIVAVESLIRWFHHEKGPISPGWFIPVAEEKGFILDIGRWVLKQALSDIHGLNGELGTQLAVTINISRRQLQDETFYLQLQGLMAELPVSAQQIVLEITESALVDSHQKLIEQLYRIQQLGIQYALDDFGTGYSSLASVRDFPLSTLKIDKSFIRDCPQDEQANKVVEAIIHMANALGIQVVAEGVEQIDQVRFLKRLQCTYAQGFYYHRPMPLDELRHLMQSGTAARKHHESGPESAALADMIE
ncbi:bifunctional diguanylate cyclase/phosphodiesterase [Photobacterium sp. Hal280]|uniref:bifunctional diguanylate cyclase/phosphodiesterase n=1 Tax=Photobacterium sp. Hal280 TaxID=3035163 RepID=UPI00301C9E17